MKNNNSILDLNSGNKSDHKNSLNSVYAQNAILTKQLQSAESNNQNITSLYATMVNKFDESKQRDDLIMEMLGSIKADYHKVVGQKIVNDKAKHVQFDEQDYKEFFQDEIFQLYFRKYLQKYHVVLQYR
jgi:hypothetical protein